MGKYKDDAAQRVVAVLANICCLFGLGQCIKGEWAKGFAFFLGMLVAVAAATATGGLLFFLPLILWFWGILDAAFYDA